MDSIAAQRLEKGGGEKTVDSAASAKEPETATIKLKCLDFDPTFPGKNYALKANETRGIY